jgi:hypothetical protein
VSVGHSVVRSTAEDRVENRVAVRRHAVGGEPGRGVDGDLGPVGVSGDDVTGAVNTRLEAVAWVASGSTVNGVFGPSDGSS